MTIDSFPTIRSGSLPPSSCAEARPRSPSRVVLRDPMQTSCFRWSTDDTLADKRYKLAFLTTGK